MSQTSIAWFFDYNFFQYGYTIWELKGKDYHLKSLDHGVFSPIEIIELLDSQTGHKRIFLDKSDVNLLLKEHTSHSLRYDRIERAIPLSQQIVKFRSLINREQFFVDERFFQKDLIFDDSSLNLVDPVSSDLQTAFPITEALLLFCEGVLSSIDYSWIESL